MVCIAGTLVATTLGLQVHGQEAEALEDGVQAPVNICAVLCLCLNLR